MGARGARGFCSSSPRSGFATASSRCCRWRREHSRAERLPRRRIGGARARRAACRRCRGGALPAHQARRRLPATGDAAPAWRWAGSRRPTSTCSPCRAIRARTSCARPGSCSGTGRRARWRRGRATWSACGRCPATIAEALGDRRSAGAVAAAICRAPSGASCERGLRLALRRGGDLRDRRVRRLRQHVVGPARRLRG